MPEEQLDLLHESQSTVKVVLSPYEAMINDAIERAWRRWRERSPEELLALNNGRTRAAVMWSYMIAEVTRALAGLPGVVIRPGGNTCNFILRGKVLFRLKKLTRSGQSRNYPTATALDYYAQFEIPGMPRAIRVDIGYVLTRTASDIERILVACRDGQAVSWAYPISSDMAVAPSVPEVPVVEPVRKRRIRRPAAADRVSETQEG